MGEKGKQVFIRMALRSSCVDVLTRRYAAGELTDEEFDAKRRRLEGH